MGMVFKGRPEAGGGVSTAALWANDRPCPESTTHKGSVVDGSGVFQEQQRAEGARRLEAKDAEVRADTELDHIYRLLFAMLKILSFTETSNHKRVLSTE